MRKKFLLLLLPLLINFSCSSYTGLRLYEHPLQVGDMTGKKANYLLEDLGVPDKIRECVIEAKTVNGERKILTGFTFIYYFSNDKAYGTRSFCIMKKIIVSEGLYMGFSKNEKEHDFFKSTTDYFTLGHLFREKLISPDADLDLEI